MRNKLDDYGPVADSSHVGWLLEDVYSLGVHHPMNETGNKIQNWKSFVSSAPVLIYDREIQKLEEEVKELKGKLEAHLLSEHRLPEHGESECITVRDIPLEQAEKEVAKYFLDNDGREIGYDELIEKLGIEPKIVISACQSLVESGKIG